MWGLFELLKFSGSCLFWGILITILCIGLFVFLIRGWYKNAMFTPVSYLVGIVLFFLLSFQCTMIVGAIKIINLRDYYEMELQSITSKDLPQIQSLTIKESNVVMDDFIAEFPVLNHYIRGGEFYGMSSEQLPAAIADELCSFMRFYILRRVLWCIGFVIVSAVIVIKSIGNQYKNTRRPSSRRPMGGSTRRRVARPRRRV